MDQEEQLQDLMTHMFSALLDAPQFQEMSNQKGQLEKMNFDEVYDILIFQMDEGQHYSTSPVKFCKVDQDTNSITDLSGAQDSDAICYDTKIVLYYLGRRFGDVLAREPSEQKTTELRTKLETLISATKAYEEKAIANTQQQLEGEPAEIRYHVRAPNFSLQMETLQMILNSYTEDDSSYNLEEMEELTKWLYAYKQSRDEFQIEKLIENTNKFIHYFGKLLATDNEESHFLIDIYGAISIRVSNPKEPMIEPSVQGLLNYQKELKLKADFYSPEIDDIIDNNLHKLRMCSMVEDHFLEVKDYPYEEFEEKQKEFVERRFDDTSMKEYLAFSECNRNTNFLKYLWTIDIKELH